MSAGGQWDQGPPPGGGYAPPTRSGANTAVAVLNFVMGGLGIICGILNFIGAGAAASVASGMGAPGGILGFLIAIAFIVSILYLLIGGGGIAAGVGVLNRRSWGRVLTLVLAGVSVLLALLNLLAVFAGQIPGLVGVLIFAGYAATCFVILLNPQNAREFS